MTTENNHNKSAALSTHASNNQTAALRGAAVAFGKPPLKPKPKLNDSTDLRGALAAATRAERASNPHGLLVNNTGSQGEDTRLRLRRQQSDGSSGNSSAGGRPSTPVAIRRLSSQFSKSDATGHLIIPGGQSADRSSSPSFIAAALAASRSASMSPNHTGQSTISPSARYRVSPNHTGQQPLSPSAKQRRPSPARRPQSAQSVTRSLSRASEAQNDTLDLSSIPPTTSLIGMFEESGANPVAQRPTSTYVAEWSPQSRTKRPQTPRSQAAPIKSEGNTSSNKPETALKSGEDPVKPTKRPDPAKVAPTSTSPPPLKRTPQPEIKSPKPLRAQTALLKTESPVSIKPRPAIASGQSSSGPATPIKKPHPLAFSNNDDDDASSEDSFVSASETRKDSLVTVSESKPIPVPPPARRQRPRPPSVSPSFNSMTIDSMANAIVASSLASSRTASRAASPTKSSFGAGPPLPPPRRSKTPSIFHHHGTRTPSPPKGFRTTMRKPKEEVEEDFNMTRMGKKHLMKKHPNKHHEGDRKRWRDSITERERKRYEAVWASNKGLFISNAASAPGTFPPPPKAAGAPPQKEMDPERLADCVSNIVVRDIWSRSRLGAENLSEVYELVDRTHTGKLAREEFVAGLWLIDQRLKGRKLPVRVSPSVWASAGASIGVKVRNNGRK
jgi:hypothetical protein